MVKAFIYFTLIALSASSVLAEVPEAYNRRESPEDEVLARESDDILEEREYAPTMFSREDDTASLQEREPFAFLAPLIGIAARVGGRVAARAGARVGRRVANDRINQRRNNRRRRRDLEPEDELDIAAREDMDELAERELDMVEREMNENDITEREVLEDDFDLD
jgi:hypothetical protein